ncbi:MAG: protein kinase [Alphaproteobacteria bacterium]|nr:protein kinase [Alphaproteobacteria bacterium]MCB9699595.1 protein kinase [Alphaproteobacteria bacterium]
MRFGAWEVEAELGRGGMGVVYAATHPDGRRAALKVLLHSSPRLRAGLWREVFALRRVRHPQIVQVLDHGEQGDVPWIAMELLEGRTLRERVSPHPHGTPTFDLDGPDDEPLPTGGGEGIPVQEALDLLAALCHPLATLHGAGLVHQDLKLENVMVRDGVPVLLDLGLSTVARSRDRLRGAGSSSATPTTVSPEQVLGDVVDARADLYALGCIAFELLTGRPPFTGSVREVVAGHLERPPPLVSDLAPDVPRSVVMLVDALLRKDRRIRPGHAMAVEAALLASGAATPPSASLPPPRPYLYRPTLAGASEVADRLRAVVRRGTGGAACVVARSGQGKTRLLLEAATEARQGGVAVVTMDCTAAEEGGSAPVVRVLERLGELSGVAGGGSWWEGLGPVLSAVAPSLSDVAGVVSEPRPRLLEPAAARERLVEAVVELVTRARARLPIAMLVDDLQWGSDLVRDLVRELAVRAGPGLAVLVAWREEEEDDELRSLREGRLVVVPPPLRSADVAAILGDMVGAPPPEALMDEIEVAAAGSALWVTELASAALHAGRLARERGGWRMVPGPALIATPSAVVELRTSGLQREVLEVLGRAAAQGKRIEPELLGLPEPQVREGLRVLAERGLIEDDGRRLVFAHDQLRTGVLSRLGDEGRIGHHRALAEVLGDEPPPEHLEMLARHLTGARDPAAGEAWARAARWQEECVGDATGAWSAALACSEGPTLETIERRTALVKQLARHGGRRADAQLATLRDEVAALGGSRAEAALIEAEAYLAQIRSDLPGLLALVRRGVALCGPQDRARRLRLAMMEGVALRRLRRTREASETMRAALADAGPEDEVCGMWCMLAIVHTSMEEPHQARVALAGAEASCRGPMDEAQVVDVRMIVEHENIEAGLALLPRVELVLERLLVDAPVDWWSNIAGHAAAFYFEYGRYEDAVRTARISLRGAERIGALIRQCYGWYYLGHALRSLGEDLDGAREAGERVVAIGDTIASPSDAADGWCLLGYVALAAGTDARPHLERARAAVAHLDLDLHTTGLLDGLERSIARADVGLPLWRGSDPGVLAPLQLERALAEGLDPRWAEAGTLSAARPGPG